MINRQKLLSLYQFSVCSVSTFQNLAKSMIREKLLKKVNLSCVIVRHRVLDYAKMGVPNTTLIVLQQPPQRGGNTIIEGHAQREAAT